MERRNTLRTLSVVLFLYYGAIGSWNFCIVYLRELGFTSGELGWMTAAGTGLGLIVLPFLGVLSDKASSPRRILLCCAAALIPLKLLLPVTGALLGKVIVPFALLVAFNLTTVRAATTMSDAWTGDVVSRMGLPHGRVRSFGSIGHVCVSLLCSLLIGPVLPSWACAPFFALLSAALFAVVLRAGRTVPDLPRTQGAAETAKASTGVSPLRLVLRNYYFLIYLLLVLGYCTFLGLVDLDLSYIMDAIGTPRSNIGLVGSWRAAVEVMVMALLCRRPRRRTGTQLWLLLTLSGTLVGLEQLSYAALTGLGGMLAVTTLTGAAGGLYYGLNANYIFEIVDRRAAGTAMSLAAVVHSLIGVVGAALGGRIIERYGVLTLTTGAGLLILSLTALFALLCALGRFVWKLPYAGEQTCTGTE